MSATADTRQPSAAPPPGVEVIRPIAAPAAAEAVQFVAPAGTLTDLGESYGVDMQLAQTLFRDMYRARRFDQEGLALQRQGELGLWLMCLGQEAAQVGSIRALRDDDPVFPSYREHAAALCRGVAPAELLAQWRGVGHSGWDPHRYRFAMYSLVLGAQTLHATGYAMGVVRDGTDEVVMTYFGEGAASQGDVNEALNWAATTAVPVLFFCQNNQWAISTPVSQQTGSSVHQRAAGFGLDAYVVDGNDALAVHAVTSAAASGVRGGGGPALIEAVTYRMAGHSTADDPTRYRDQGEVELWQQRDPLTRLRALLDSCGTPTAFFHQIEAEAEDLAQQARRACLSLPEPRLTELFGSVYAEAHDELERQADQHAAYLASFDPPR